MEVRFPYQLSSQMGLFSQPLQSFRVSSSSLEEIEDATTHRRDREFFQTELGQLYTNLLLPFKEEDEVHLWVTQVQIEEVTPQLFPQVADIINWGYNRRYKVQDGTYISLVPQVSKITDDNIRVFAAVLPIGSKKVVLSTLSVMTGHEIEIFELFEVHEPVSQAAAEVKRMAKHPIFDVLELSHDEEVVQLSKQYAKAVMRLLWQHVTKHIAKRNIVPYYILAPHVKKWLEAAGLSPVREVHSTPKHHHPKYQELLKVFPYYWQKNPQVYIAPHQVEHFQRNI